MRISAFIWLFSLALGSNLLVVAQENEFDEYHNYNVVEFYSISQLQLQAFEQNLHLDIWHVLQLGKNNLTITALVSELEMDELTKLMGELQHKVIIEDISQQITEEHKRVTTQTTTTDNFFQDFRSLQDINNYYKTKIAEHPTLASYSTIGSTYESRDIYGVVVNAPPSPLTLSTREAKPRLFFECQIHAREWISAPTCAWIFTQLVDGYGSDPDASYVLDNFDVLIVPVVNPDGYSYTWTNDRMWRKNRVPIHNSSCVGIDLNRNWPMEWRSSSSPCSDTYPGSKAASELETQAIGKFIEESKVDFAIDFHSYGNLILRPWGYTYSPCPDESLLKKLGDSMRDAIYAVHGERYTSQQSSGLYPANGETTDYYYATKSVTPSLSKPSSWGFTFELRGRSFIIQPNQIIPQGQEIWAAVVEAAHFVAVNPPK